VSDQLGRTEPCIVFWDSSFRIGGRTSCLSLWFSSHY